MYKNYSSKNYIYKNAQNIMDLISKLQHSILIIIIKTISKFFTFFLRSYINNNHNI